MNVGYNEVKTNKQTKDAKSSVFLNYRLSLKNDYTDPQIHSFR